MYIPNKVYIHVTGSKHMYAQSGVTDKEIEKLKEILDWRQENDAVVFTIPPEQAVYRREFKSVQACAYEATNKFLESMLGLKLDEADRQWFVNHPLVNSSGLPQEHTLTVLSDLVAPYNVGISRVIMQKGTSTFEETNGWKACLGCNPMALLDTNVSNEDYLNTVAPEGSDVRDYFKESLKQFRFEHSNDISGIPLVTFGLLGNATSFASGGGHASYRGPRTRNTYALAIQFDRLSNITYNAPVPTHNSVGTSTPEVNLIPDFWECKVSLNGKTLKQVAWNGVGYSGYSGYTPPNFNHIAGAEPQGKYLPTQTSKNSLGGKKNGKAEKEDSSDMLDNSSLEDFEKFLADIGFVAEISQLMAYDYEIHKPICLDLLGLLGEIRTYTGIISHLYSKDIESVSEIFKDRKHAANDNLYSSIDNKIIAYLAKFDEKNLQISLADLYLVCKGAALATTKGGLLAKYVAEQIIYNFKFEEFCNPYIMPDVPDRPNGNHKTEILTH